MEEVPSYDVGNAAPVLPPKKKRRVVGQGEAEGEGEGESEDEGEGEAEEGEGCYGEGTSGGGGIDASVEVCVLEADEPRAAEHSALREALRDGYAEARNAFVPKLSGWIRTLGKVELPESEHSSCTSSTILRTKS